jgi:hypothetical protein
MSENCFFNVKFLPLVLAALCAVPPPRPPPPVPPLSQSTLSPAFSLIMEQGEELSEARLYARSANVIRRRHIQFTVLKNRGGAFELLFTLLAPYNEFLQPFDVSVLDLVSTSNSGRFEVELKFDVGRHQIFDV